jgi:O-antigen/teichoic acid export membrane protein
LLKSISSKLNWFNLRDFLKFTSGNFIFQIVSIFSEMYVLKLVSVSEMGLWQFCLLLQGYIVIYRMGILNSYNREYVMENESGNKDFALRIFQTTSFHTIVSSILQSLTFLIISIYFFTKDGNDTIGFALIAMSFFTIFESLNNFEEAKLRSKLKFDKIAKSKLHLTIITVLTLIFPYYWGFWGLIFRAGLNQVFYFVIYRLLDNEAYSMKFSSSTWISLFKDGWKFWLLAYIKIITKSLPKLFLATFAGVSVLGLFTPVNWVLLAFTVFTGNLTSYLYPLFTQQFAKGNLNLIKDSQKINLISLIVVIPGVILIFLFSPFLITLFLPEYIISIDAIRITTIASVFDVIALSTSVWYAQKDWRKLFIYQINLVIISFLTLSIVYLIGKNYLFLVSLSILITSIFSVILFYLLNNNLLKTDNLISKKQRFLHY